METPTSPRPSPAQVLRATRPWWVVPILVLLGLGVALALKDTSPMRSLAYSVQ